MPDGGSIGAVDGTYSVRPKVSRNILIANDLPVNKEFLYSDYIKESAFKLLITTSHGILGPKLILFINITNGTVSDCVSYCTKYPLVKSIIVVLLGDHAFQACPNVICPYSNHDMNLGSHSRTNGYKTIRE